MTDTHTRLHRTQVYTKQWSGLDPRTFCLIGRADDNAKPLSTIPSCPFCAVIRDLWLETHAKTTQPTVRRFRAWMRQHPQVVALRNAATVAHAANLAAKKELARQVKQTITKAMETSPIGVSPWAGPGIYKGRR